MSLSVGNKNIDLVEVISETFGSCLTVEGLGEGMKGGVNGGEKDMGSVKGCAGRRKEVIL